MTDEISEVEKIRKSTAEQREEFNRRYLLEQDLKTLQEFKQRYPNFVKVIDQKMSTIKAKLIFMELDD